MYQKASFPRMILTVIRVEIINSIMNIKTIFLTLILFSGQVSAWYGPGPGFFPPGGCWGCGYGMGYMYPPLQYPTFNYQQTVIVQEPPPPAQVIIREQPRVIVEEREVIRDNPRYIEENERLRGYFNKR